MSSCSILDPCSEVKLQQQHAAFNIKPRVFFFFFRGISVGIFWCPVDNAVTNRSIIQYGILITAATFKETNLEEGMDLSVYAQLKQLDLKC